MGNAPIHIVPAGMGAGGRGGGAGKLIVGAVIIAAAVVTQNYAIIPYGLALAVSGVAQIIAPNVKPNAAASAGSSVFTSVTNTSTEGSPIPIVYGRVMVGSVVGSVYMGTEKLPSPYLPPTPQPTVFPGVQVLVQT